MNDNELIAMVRESLTGIHTTTPVEQIVSRGRAVRVRRRILGLSGAVAVVTAVALAVTSLLPGAHRASPRPTAQLAAWTVTRQAEGSIRVTIRELRDPTGLQSKLRADGVPASVTLIGQQNPSCQRYPVSQALMHRVFLQTAEVLPPPQGRLTDTPPSHLSLVVIILIHSSALPRGTGVQLASTFRQLPPRVASGTVGRIELGTFEKGLVYASPRCTG